RVDNPHEPPCRCVDEVAYPADLQTGGTEQGTGLLHCPGTEKHAIAGTGSDEFGQVCPLRLPEVLGHRPRQSAVFADQYVRQTLGSALLGPLLPCVELPPWLPRAAGHDDGTHIRRLEYPKIGIGEVLGAVDKFLS